MASIRGRLGQSNTIKVVASNSVTGSVADYQILLT